MMILTIPDVHLKPYIFIRAKELLREGMADIAVCLMDISDDWKKQLLLEEYTRTYNAAIEFAKEFPNSLWCYGNHDLSYLWNEKETGYSSMAKQTVQQKIVELSSVLSDKNPIKYVQKVDGILFCHGGISKNFVEKICASFKV